MALTTTTGFCASRPLTISAARSMALASCTEVPPNFITIIGRRTSDANFPDQPPPPCSIETSPQITPHFEQFSIQQGRSRRASDSVVGEHGELPIQNAAGPQTTDRGRHPVTRFDVEPGLRPVCR